MDCVVGCLNSTGLAGADVEALPIDGQAGARLLDGEDVPRFGDLPLAGDCSSPTGSASSRDTSADNTTRLHADHNSRGSRGMLFGRVAMPRLQQDLSLIEAQDR